VRYVTDPADPWSWAAEPALRRLDVEFGDEVRITYVMGGLARQLDDGARLARVALEASAAGGMPVDVRMWLDSPPLSSYPACLAVKAAAEQGLDGPVLRVLREGFMVDRRRQDSPDALLEAAGDVAGLDRARFEVDLRSNAIVEAFAADLERARAGEGLPLPGWVVGERVVRDPGELRDAVLAAGASPRAPLPLVEEFVRRFRRVATAEVAAACDLPGPRAAAELWRLALDWRVRSERVLGGELWSPA
jgi:predicted DsbA family dithiol-disulfide isomerase